MSEIGMSADDADKLTTSDGRIDSQGINRAQGVLRDELDAAINRLMRDSHLTYVDILGTLTCIKHDLLHLAREGGDE